MCVVWEVGLEVASPTLYTSVMTKCQFGDSLSCAGLLSSRCGQARIVCVPSPTPTSDHHGDVPSRRGVSNMSGMWLILSVCVWGRLIEETKSNHCWSFLPLLLHFYKLNLLRHSSCFFTLLFLLHLAVFSPFFIPPTTHTHTQMCVWSHCVATSLAQVSRQECSVALQAFAVIVAFDEGQSVGQPVQVSSLTGSCPYQPFVPPCDRLKVAATVEYIDNNGVFICFPFLCSQWLVIGEVCCLKSRKTNKCRLAFGFLFYCQKSSSSDNIIPACLKRNTYWSATDTGYFQLILIEVINIQ